MASASEGRSGSPARWARAFGAVCVGVLVIVACGEGIGRALFGVYLSGLPTATGALLSAYAFLLMADALARGALSGTGRFGTWLAERSPLTAAVRRAFVGLLATGVVVHIALASGLGAYRFLSRTTKPVGPADLDPIVALAQAAVAAGAVLAAVPLLTGLRETGVSATAVWRRGGSKSDAASALAVTACFALAIWAAHSMLDGDAAWSLGDALLLGAAMVVLLAGGIHAALVMVLFFPAIAGFDADPGVSRIYLLGSEAAIVPLIVLLALAYRAAGLVGDLETAGRWMFGRVRTGAGLAFFFRDALAGAVSVLRQKHAERVAEEDIPRLVRAGFWPRRAVGSVAAASAFGAVLPPSLLLSLYAMESHSDSFAFAGLAGVLLVLASMCLVSLPGSLRKGAPLRAGGAGTAAPRAAAAMSAAGRAAAPPAIVLAGVFLERFTLSEASAIAVIAVVAIGIASRRMGCGEVWPLLASTARLAVPILFILVAGGVYAWLMTAAGLPQFLTLRMDDPTALAAGGAVLIGAVVLLRWFEVDAVSTLMVLFPIWLPLMKVLSDSIAPDRFGVLLLLVVQTVALLVPGDAYVAAVRRALGDRTLQRRRIAGAAFPFAAIALAVTILLAAASHTG